MESLLTQIQNLAKSVDEEARKTLLDSLRDLQYSIETPYDTLQRFGNLHLQISAARIGVDLGLFDAIHESKEPLSVATLIEKTGASPGLLSRLLRYLASNSQVKETSKDCFGSSKTTAVLADKNYQGGIHHFFDTVGPVLQELPDFLAPNKYEEITDNSKTALQKAFNTELPGFIWFPSQPQRFEYFQRVMTVQRAGAPTWLSSFPFEELGNFKDGTVLVDIGGGFGHQSHVPAIDGVEVQVHNFFEPQVVKGAKFYYLRNILHDWPDDKAIVILKNLISTLGPESRILIDDMVLPNENVHWQATSLDLVMMSALASKERTDEQWRSLIKAAGLQILEIFKYTTTLGDSIIMVAPK